MQQASKMTSAAGIGQFRGQPRTQVDATIAHHENRDAVDVIPAGTAKLLKSPVGKIMAEILLDFCDFYNFRNSLYIFLSESNLGLERRSRKEVACDAGCGRAMNDASILEQLVSAANGIGVASEIAIAAANDAGVVCSSASANYVLSNSTPARVACSKSSAKSQRPVLEEAVHFPSRANSGGRRRAERDKKSFEEIHSPVGDTAEQRTCGQCAEYRTIVTGTNVEAPSNAGSNALEGSPGSGRSDCVAADAHNRKAKKLVNDIGAPTATFRSNMTPSPVVVSDQFVELPFRVPRLPRESAESHLLRRQLYNVDFERWTLAMRHADEGMQNISCAHSSSRDRWAMAMMYAREQVENRTRAQKSSNGMDKKLA